ncbi:MAG: hypothetical protein U0930_07260 [Pirellulales bacterium]
MNEVGALMLGIGIGALLVSCLAFPQVSRIFAKSIAVLGIGVGIGLLTWGILGATGMDFQPLRAGPIQFMHASQAIGWGAGSLGAGVTALVLAFVHGRSKD